MSSKYQNLDTCGCCEGISYLTPASVENTPGLDALVYRVGTHSSFKSSMQTGISSKTALDKLTTRDDDDSSIALLDAWATVLDVLTFYQERIINEGYLRTATERRSVLELSRHISYKLSPGVAAGTYMAFTMEEAPGAPSEATIPVGTKVQSIPGQDEMPQVFETADEIEAKTYWNAIKPRMTQPQEVLETMGSIILKGTTTNLKPGDIVMILIDTTKTPKKVLNVTIDDEAETTRIDFEDPSLSPLVYERPAALPEGSLEDLKNEEELNSNVVDIILSRTWKEEVLLSLLEIKNWSDRDLVTSINKQFASYSYDSGKGIFVFRKQAFVFGYNAPKQITCNASTGDINPPADWVEWELEDEEGGKIFLDTAYNEILPQSYILIIKSDGLIDSPHIFQVTDVNVSSRTAYGISSKTTLLSLSPDDQWWETSTNGLSAFRSITIYAQSEQLDIAEVPVKDLLQGDTITLEGPYPGLKSGQRIIITGEREDLKGIYASEMKVIEEVILEAGYTVITFEESLVYKYVRDTVSINANVTRATHGETKTEILGSGDGSKTFQEFQLKQTPLTYVSAATASGTETTLEIRVNDILWKEVSTLYGVSSEDRVYITRIADDGTVTVQFGDGKTGARLPTGTENVKATYRVGTGLDGLLDAEQLSLLMTPQLGVKSVINPLAPSGADDPEERDNARRNAPLTVLSLDRIVSLRDYEDFTLAFAGIGKARADLLWNGEQQVVYITISSADGEVVDENSDLYINLSAAIDEAHHANHQVQIGSFQPLFFDVKAKVLIDPDYIIENVLTEVKQELKEVFDFEARDFGQTVTPSEVTAVIQVIEGVIAVDLDELDGQDPFAKEHFRLPSRIARWDGNKIAAAELLTINPDGIEIKDMSS